MGIYLDWRETEGVIIYQVVDPWTMNDLYQAVKTGFDLTKEVTDLVIIYDLQQTHHLPPSFLSGAGYLTRMKQENVSLRILVGVGMLVKAIIHILEKARPQLIADIKMVSTLEEALALMQTRQPPTPVSAPKPD